MTVPKWLQRFRSPKAVPPSAEAGNSSSAPGAASNPHEPAHRWPFSSTTQNGQSQERAYFDVGLRRARMVLMGIQQKQCALNGWNYACRFRS